MVKKKQRKKRIKELKKRHYFFLNPYQDCAFTKCPQCDAKTKVRKFPLVINIEPQKIFILNKTCKYCVDCDLIITKQAEVEQLLAAAFLKINPEIIGNDYVVMGTLDNKDWRSRGKGNGNPSIMLKKMYVFKDCLDFEVAPAGWHPDLK